MPPADPDKPRRRLPPWILPAIVAAGIAFLLWIHPFLAITRPVDARVLVVEGWVPDYVLDAAAHEFRTGHYSWLFVSGLPFEPGEPDYALGSNAKRCVRHLIHEGLDPKSVVAAPSVSTSWNRTSAMARAVADQIRARGLGNDGVNIVTLGPHARQTLLAYHRMLGPAVRVGVISIPKDDYVASHWWTSAAGIRKTLKDFAGWVKELIAGSRS